MEWCKNLEYPTTDKSGGWVSENFLAMSRFSNWFYPMLLRFISIPKEYIDPVSHYSTWNKSQCEKWLHVRGKEKHKRKLNCPRLLRIILKVTLMFQK